MGTPYNEAEKRYRTSKSKQSEVESKEAHESSNKLIQSKEEVIKQSNKKVIDQKTGEVEIENKAGKERYFIKLAEPDKDKIIRIKPIDSLPGDALWEPTVIDENAGVFINTSHVYYNRLYLPNANNVTTIQGMDALLYAMAEVEWSNINPTLSKIFKTMGRSFCTFD